MQYNSIFFFWMNALNFIILKILTFIEALFLVKTHVVDYFCVVMK